MSYKTHGFNSEGKVSDAQVMSVSVHTVNDIAKTLSHKHYLEWKKEMLLVALKQRVSSISDELTFEEQQQLDAQIVYTKRCISVTEKELSDIK